MLAGVIQERVIFPVSASDGTTQVTQYLDCSQTPSKLVKSELSWAPKAMAKTLVRFKEYIE